jgi:hypothetical protein
MEPTCPKCGEMLKTVVAVAIDGDGEEVDYEGLVCPNGCSLES